MCAWSSEEGPEWGYNNKYGCRSSLRLNDRMQFVEEWKKERSYCLNIIGILFSLIFDHILCYQLSYKVISLFFSL